MSLRYIVLGLISEKVYYGYELKQEISEIFGKTWPVSYGQLYPTLKRLTECGYLLRTIETGEKGQDKYIYEITQLGKSFFNRWKYKIPKHLNYTGKDEISLLLAFLIRSGDQVQEEKVRQFHLQHIRASIEQTKSLYRNALLDGEVIKSLLLKRMILRMNADLEWLITLSGFNEKNY